MAMNTMDATHSLLVDIGTERNKCLNVLPFKRIFIRPWFYFSIYYCLSLSRQIKWETSWLTAIHPIVIVLISFPNGQAVSNVYVLPFSISLKYIAHSRLLFICWNRDLGTWGILLNIHVTKSLLFQGGTLLLIIVIRGSLRMLPPLRLTKILKRILYQYLVSYLVYPYSYYCLS